MIQARIKDIALGAGLVTAGVLVVGEAAFAYQGHMFSALSDLRAARFQLNAAIPDKGGHRDAAMGLIDQTIAQVRQGIAAGR